MNPTKPDAQLLPKGSRSGETLRFTYRKDGPNLTYAVKTSVNLEEWLPAVPAEISNGTGSFRRDFPLTPGSFFVRLEIMP